MKHISDLTWHTKINSRWITDPAVNGNTMKSLDFLDSIEQSHKLGIGKYFLGHKMH